MLLDLGLRVNKLGKSSVTYEIAVFEHGAEDVRAVGEFIHVFVDKASNRPAVDGMSVEIRQGLQRLLIKGTSKL
jgi:acyl-CoA thioester hydrolase